MDDLQQILVAGDAGNRRACIVLAGYISGSDGRDRQLQFSCRVLDFLARAAQILELVAEIMNLDLRLRQSQIVFDGGFDLIQRLLARRRYLQRLGR